MDNIYDIYDVPVFKSLPSLINFNNPYNSNNLNNSKKLYDISARNMYEDEPFTNNNKEYSYFLLIFLVILIIYILYFY